MLLVSIPSPTVDDIKQHYYYLLWHYYYLDDIIILLKETLQNEAGILVQWFRDNLMIVNPGKFQAMIINRFGKMENKHEMYTENKKITEHSVKLQGIAIDNQLNFDNV